MAWYQFSAQLRALRISKSARVRLLCVRLPHVTRSPATTNRSRVIALSITVIPCEGVKDTPNGQQIRSRYYPVHSYAVCSNDRPWAWCLDKPCIVDRNNPEAASCACDVVKNLGDYVIVTSNYAPNTCTTGVISSATIQQITQITDYLKTKTKVLTPFNIRVLKK